MSKTMKASMLRLAVIAMALVMLLGMLPAGVFAAETDPTTAIKPVADTYVSYANHTTNYGNADTLLVDGSMADEKIAFLSYEAWHFLGVEDATLNLPMTVTTAGDVSVYLIDDYLIDEDKLNWANMPSLGSAKKLTTTAADGALTVDLSGETFGGEYFTIVVRADQQNRIYEENFNDVPLQSYTAKSSEKVIGMLYRGEEKQDEIDNQIYSEKLLGLATNNNAPSTGIIAAIANTYDAATKTENPALGRSLKNNVEVLLYNSLKDSPLVSDDATRSFKVYYRAYTDVEGTGKVAVYVGSASGAQSWKRSPETTVGQWTTLSAAVTLTEANVSAQQGMISIFYTKSLTYLDDIFVVETTSGKTWNTVSASMGSKEGTSPATVSFVGTPDFTAFKPVSQTYVSSSAPDTAFGANALTDLEIGDGKIALVTFDVSSYRNCASLELLLPIHGEAIVSLMEYQVDEDTFTYNTYKALTAEKTGKGIFKGPYAKIDLATYISAMSGDYLTVVLESVDYYEQDFESITSVTYIGSDIVMCVANEDGTITDWGSNTIYYDESAGKFLFRYGGAGGTSSLALASEGDNQYIKLIGHTSSATYGAEVKLHNLLGKRQMTAEDVGKTYRITFDMKSNQTAQPLSVFVKSPDNVYAADETTKIHQRTTNMLTPTPSFTAETADTWKTYTFDVTLTADMVKWQGVIDFVFNIPNRDGTLSNYFAIDNLKSTLVGDTVKLSAYDAGASLLCATVLHEHAFDKKVMNSDTFASMSEGVALYYYSCACGAVGTETFEGGSHVHASGTPANETTPQLCDTCGAMMAPPTDPTITARHKVGDATEWTYSTFAAAMTAANGKTAKVELLADTVISANIAIEGGTISIGSIAYAGEEGKAFELSRAESFADNSLFSVSGGAKLTVTNVVFNGKNVKVNVSGGGIFHLSGTGTTLDATNVKLINSNTSAYSDSRGGAVHAKSGAVFTLTNGEIRSCTAKRGPAVYIVDSGTVFNMNDSLIEGCTTTNVDTAHGAAVALYGGSATFNMNGGLITGNRTYRTNMGKDNGTAQTYTRPGIYMDGAVGISSTNYINLSGDAIIRDNIAYKVSDAANGTKTTVYDAGIIGFNTGVFKASHMNVSSDFTGSVAYGYYIDIADNSAIATPTGDWESSETIIPSFIDNHYVSIDDPRAIRVGKLVDGEIVWVKAQAEVDVDGKITRYATFADAYAAVGNKAPIKLLADAQVGTNVFEAGGDQLKVILNGYNVTFLEDITCDTPVTATETVGAFTLYGYTYEGYDAEVTTFTASYVPHTHTSDTEASTTAGKDCDVRGCGALMAYPTDETLNTRYSLDGGATWTYATFANAMSAVNGKEAIVEFFRDITVTENSAISSGDVIIRSVPAEKNLVEPGKICTLTRDSSFTTDPMFSISGGAAVVFDDVALDGARISLSDINGALINITGSTTVTMNDGVTLKDSYTAKSVGTGFGGAVYITTGGTFNMKGGLIQNCRAKNGGAVYIGHSGSTVKSTFNMSGGLITGCQAPTGWDQASAVMLAHYADFNMSGGMIAGNQSKRNNNQEPGGTKYGSIVDGAVNFLYGSSFSNHMTISGNAIIRNNGGYRNVDGTLEWSDDNADVTFFRDRCDVDGSAVITIKSDFTGSVGIANPNSVATTEAESVVIAGFEGYTSTDNNKILGGIIDNNSENRVAIIKSGKLYFKDATAQLDIDGKITRYVSFDAAYDIVGDTMPIEMIADASVTLDAIGDSVKVIENGHTLKVNFYGGFDKSDAVAETVGAFKCEEIEFPGVEMNVVTVTAVDGGSIANISGLVGTDLSLRFYTYLGDAYADSVLRVTRNGVTTEITESVYDEDLGQYHFTYTQIAPQCMGDTVTAELVHDGEVLDSISSYSLLTYYKTLLGMSDSALGMTATKGKEMRALLCDLLAYGAAAQKYTDYNTDVLVNDGYTASEFVPMAESVRKITVNNTVDGYTFKSAGLRFANVNNLYFKFNTPDVANTKLVVNGEEKTASDFTKSGTSYVYFTEDLYATDFDKLFTVELYAGDTLVQTLTYSVSAYVYSMLDHADDTVKELAMATYNYGVAARVFTDSITNDSHTVSSISGATILGGATLDGTALNVDKTAAGIEFAIRGKGNITLNITAEADARFEIAVDRTNKIEHYLVSAGTADYELPFELYDGMHTVRIVQETGSFTINSISFKGYIAATDAKDLYIEFVGDELLAGRYMYLNPDEVIDDATAAYAFLAASELNAQYVISPTSKYLTDATASTNVPALVVIDYQQGSTVDYATIVANLKATYGADVNILFAAGAMNTPDVDTLSALGAYVTLTTDNSGYEAYPSKSASALNGAELAKYIRENYDFFTAEQVSTAQKDMIVQVDAVSNGYNTFHVYVKTSDPSGDVYVRYNFIYEYNDTRTSYGSNTTTNISNFRVKAADIVRVTNIGETNVTYEYIKQALQQGEISMAIKTYVTYIDPEDGLEKEKPAGDFTGGYHGDERLTYVRLLADGEEITIANGTETVITCNSVVFDQHTMTFEHGTSTAETYGEDLTTHNQHFVITRETGVNNRQSLEWQDAYHIYPDSMYLQMFTLNRYVKEGRTEYYDVCDIVETYNKDGVRYGRAYESGKRTTAGNVLSNTTNRSTKYSATAGDVSAVASYDICNVGTFADNRMTNNSYSISVRTQGDNKLYVNFKSLDGNDRVVEGEKWMIDVAYNIDYVTP